MKIAFIQRFLPSRSRGGVGHFTHGLANALAARGHKITVFSQDPAPAEASYEVRQLPKPACPRKAVLAFPGEIARQDFSGFQIIHAQGDDQWLPSGVPPVVRTMHGSAWAEALHNGLQRGSLKHFLMHAYFYIMELISSRKAWRVIGVSLDTSKYYPRFHGVIPNGIDCGAFASVPASKSAAPSILFVGEAGSRKRGSLLLQVFREKIRSELPEAELWMVCPEEIHEPGVRCFKGLDDTALMRLYKEAWVFCLPSSYEGFGRPYIEAMAAGTPVVASPNPGAIEILQKGKWGVLAEDKDLGRELTDLLKNETVRKEWSRRGLERVRIFDWEVVAKQYEKIYFDLTSHPNE